MSNTINLGKLELVIAEKLNENLSDFERAALSVAINQIKNAVILVVNDFLNLPLPQDNFGKIAFVEDDRVYYVSFNGRWNASFNQELLNNLLYTWGNGGNGRLGNGSTNVSYSPGTTIGAGTNWCQVDAGTLHTAAVKTDGTLWTWGANQYGRLGTGNTTDRSSPGTTVGGGTNWSQVSASCFHTAAVKQDGTLWAWGAAGALGDGASTSRSSPVTTAGGGTNWCQVSAGSIHTAAVKTDGTLWTWGNNSCGSLGTGNTTTRCSPGTTVGAGTNWCQVSAGCKRTAAVKTDGTLWTWGNNECGILGTGNTTIRSSPGTTFGVFGGGTNWCQVSAGIAQHTAAVKQDGTLWTWGYNGCGRLGDGNTTNRLFPDTTVDDATNWCQVSAGYRHTAAVKQDGTLWTWGRNNNNELGTGNTTARCSPGTTVGGGTNWVQASTGLLHTAAIEINQSSL